MHEVPLHKALVANVIVYMVVICDSHCIQQSENDVESKGVEKG